MVALDSIHGRLLFIQVVGIDTIHEGLLFIQVGGFAEVVEEGIKRDDGEEEALECVRFLLVVESGK